MKEFRPNKYAILASALFLLLVSAIYFFNQGYYIGRNPYPAGDEPDYLVGALKIKEYGGPAKILPYLVLGKFTEARKHPFYMFLLSFFAVRSLDFFVYAKFFNFVLGGLLLSASYFIMKRMFNSLAAVIFVLMVALNEMFLSETSLIVPDNLMVFLTLMSCYFYYLGFVGKFGDRVKYWILGGLFSGVAYLTKPAGILLLASFCVSAAILLKRGIFKSKAFYISVFAFLFMASPLLIRNLTLYKNPFYNDNVSLLWIENRQERRAPNFEKAPPTVFSYFAKRGVLNDGRLYVENFVKMASNFSMLILFGKWRWRFSFPLLFLAIISMRVDKDRKRSIFLGTFFVASYMFFAYNYRVSPHFRHVMPMVFIPIGFCALLFEKTPLYKVLLIAIAVGGLFGGYNKLYVEKRLSGKVFAGQIDVPEAHVYARDWLVSNIKDGDVYVMGLDDDFMFMWYSDVRGRRIIQPYFNSFEKFSEFIVENKVKYVVLGGQTVNSFPEIYRKYFVKKKNSPDYMRRVADPEGWVQVFGLPFSNEENFKVLIYDVSSLWK